MNYIWRSRAVSGHIYRIHLKTVKMRNVSNFSNNSFPGSPLHLPEYWQEPLGLMSFRLLFEVTIAFFGVIGNVLVCLVLSCRRTHVHMNTAIKTFVRNLAIADLCILVLTFPFAVTREQSPLRWLLGEFTCLYVFPLCEVFYGVSIWSITAVAIERYRIIKGASQIHQTSTKALLVSLTSIWILSFFVIAFPMLLFVKYSSKYEQCYVLWPKSRQSINPTAHFYNIMVTVFWFCLPLGIICWTYCKIGKRITQSVRAQRQILSSTSESRSSVQLSVGRTQQGARFQQNAKAKRLLTPLVLVFVFTMLPSNVFRLLTVYYPRLVWYRYSQVLYNASIIVTVAHSVANPLIYCLVSREVRQGIKQLLRRCLFNFQSTNARIGESYYHARLRLRYCC